MSIAFASDIFRGRLAGRSSGSAADASWDGWVLRGLSRCDSGGGEAGDWTLDDLPLMPFSGFCSSDSPVS